MGIAVIAIIILLVVYVSTFVFRNRKKHLEGHTYYQPKGKVKFESDLPKTGVNYGDIYEVMEPYPEYYVWCDNNEWSRIS